jgi:hypothetical protein
LYHQTGVTYQPNGNGTARYIPMQYESRVAAIAQGPFRANYGNCAQTDVNGEIGWNPPGGCAASSTTISST